MLRNRLPCIIYKFYVFFNSYESGVLEDPSTVPPQGIYKMTRDMQTTEDYPCTIDIHFDKGLFVMHL